jgi:hypothetical protein
MPNVEFKVFYFAYTEISNTSEIIATKSIKKSTITRKIRCFFQ